MDAGLRAEIDAFVARENLPADAIDPRKVQQLAVWVAERCASERRLFTLGISGAQGTGKTTLAALLETVLARGFGVRCARLSLDDLYLTRAERLQLAAAVHPLLCTRGVPGTHDVALGERVLAGLRAREAVRVPRFDKAADDRGAFVGVSPPIDCLLFEGWCLGARPEPDAALETPLNALERDEDPDGRFRRYVNAQLGGPYQRLFGALDGLVFLAAPDLECSRAWRVEQEKKLWSHAAGVMREAELRRFVQFFERITRHMLGDVPPRADAVLTLDSEHRYAHLALQRAARHE